MNQITEKDFPIDIRWVVKSALQFLIPAIVLILYYYLETTRFASSTRPKSDSAPYFSLIFAFAYPITGISVIWLRLKNFHFSLDPKCLTINQGIINKSQIHIPYGVIQNILVKQSILDRLFGLAFLTVENAVGQGAFYEGRQKVEPVGVHGNKVSIPGLKKEHAEKLKDVLLQKMKENPHTDTKSGL